MRVEDMALADRHQERGSRLVTIRTRTMTDSVEVDQTGMKGLDENGRVAGTENARVARATGVEAVQVGGAEQRSGEATYQRFCGARNVVGKRATGAGFESGAGETSHACATK